MGRYLYAPAPTPPAAPLFLERTGHAVTSGCLYLVLPLPAMLRPQESSRLVPSSPSGLGSHILLSTWSSLTTLVDLQNLQVTPQRYPLPGWIASLCASAI